MFRPNSEDDHLAETEGIIRSSILAPLNSGQGRDPHQGTLGRVGWPNIVAKC